MESSNNTGAYIHNIYLLIDIIGTLNKLSKNKKKAVY